MNFLNEFLRKKELPWLSRYHSPQIQFPGEREDSNSSFYEIDKKMC